MVSIITLPDSSSPSVTNGHHAVSPVDEIKVSFHPKNWLSLILGASIGSFIPIASWVLIGEIANGGDWRLWFLAGGGMTFSVLSVARWANTAFGGGAGTTFASSLKSVGFCMLLDGSMAFSHVRELSVAALALLVVINTVSCATALQHPHKHEMNSSPSVTSTPSRPMTNAERAKAYRARKRHERESQSHSQA